MASVRRIEMNELTEDDGTVKLCTLEGRVIVVFRPDIFEEHQKEAENPEKKHEIVGKAK